MRTTALAISMVVALGAAGCSGSEQATTAGASTAAVSAAPTVVTTATATATASASIKAKAPKPPRKAPKSHEALKKELEKRCPLEAKDSNVEQKEAVAKSTECLRKKMIADLDAVLVPLKKKDEAKFDALMKEQAEWNRNLEAACWLEEERFWIDLTTGGRDDGTLRGYTYLGCLSGAYTDRILFAQSLAAGKLEPLVKRIEAVQADGATVKSVMGDLVATGTRYVSSPPKLEDGVEAADWKKIVESSAKVQSAAKSMSKSTCEAWPDLAKALGGAEKCEAKVQLYYFAQSGSPDVGQQP